MSDFNSLPDEASPQLTDKVFTGRGTLAGAERKPTIAAMLALLATKNEIGFGAGDGVTVVPTGVSFKRMILWDCVIKGWGIVADAAGSIVMDVRKGTPDGSGNVTTTSITASATPALSSKQSASSSTLTGWTVNLSAGDILEMVVTGTPSTVKIAALTLKITRT